MTMQTTAAVAIIDSTLREGMQAPGVHFNSRQSLEIARLLARLGIEIIECGQPCISESERDRVRTVREAIAGRSQLLCHARADERDIEAVAAVGADWVGIFLGINPISLSARVPGWTREKVLLRIASTVRSAVAAGLKVRYTVEDTSRTALQDTIAAYRTALDAGASRICFADTVGILSPDQVSNHIRTLVGTFPGVPIEVHFHDDRGLALANALAAIEAGAHWVSTSVNGLGERCGIVDLMALLANLEFSSVRRIPEPGLIQQLSDRVAAYSRAFVDDRRPVIGRGAFTHTSRLHRLAQLRDRRAYEWLPPERLGRTHASCDRTPDRSVDALISAGRAIPATELRYHRVGPGTRWVLIDERYVTDCRQYCIVRRIPQLLDYGPGHVDTHSHKCDSLFVFVGNRDNLSGLTVEVELEGERAVIESPASVLIPAGIPHSYRVVAGAGFFLNHVLAGSYSGSLLDAVGEITEWLR